MQKTLLIFFLSVAASLASAQVAVTDVWVRATVQGQKATGAFMNLTAQKSTRLVGVKTEAASVAEIHEMKMENDVMRMKRVPFIDLPAGQTVALKPGGFHVMLISFITSSVSSWVPKAMGHPPVGMRAPVTSKACKSWANRCMRPTTYLLPRTSAL